MVLRALIHDPEILIQSFLTFPSNIALRQRVKGLSEIIILDTKAKQPRKLKFRDPAYSLHFSANPEYNSNKLYILHRPEFKMRQKYLWLVLKQLKELFKQFG